MAGNDFWGNAAKPAGDFWNTAADPRDEGKAGRAKAFLGGNIQGITGGYFDELSGLIGKAIMPKTFELGPAAQPAADDTPELRALKEDALAKQKVAPTSYEITKGIVQRDLDKAQQDRPGYFGGGRVTGTLMAAPFVAKALPAAMSGLGASLAVGGGMGAVGGLGESRANLARGEWQDAAKDTGVGFGLGLAGGTLGSGFARALSGLPGAAASTLGGFGTGAILSGATSEGETWGDKAFDALLGGLAGGAGGFGGYGLGRAANATVKGAVKPSPESQYLRKQGIEPTVGQMSPGSALGQFEEVGTSAAFVGPKLQAQRAAPQEAYGKALVSRAVPKGGSSLAKGGLDEQLSDAYRQQNERYDEVRASPLSARAQARPVNPAKVAKAFELAVDDPNIPTSKDQRDTARRFLVGQAGILERSGPSTKNLVEVRSNIRKAISAAEPGSPLREVYSRAEQSATNRLRYSLPAKPLQTLQETDAGYGNYKNMEAAVANAKDGKLLTPNNVTQAIKSNTDRGAYARGAGGELRQLARAGHEVFDQRVAPTGARLLASGKYNPLPWVARIANSPSVKPYALGEAPLQQKAGALIDALRANAPKMSPTSGQTVQQLFSPQPRAAYAEDDEQELRQRMLANLLSRR